MTVRILFIVAAVANPISFKDGLFGLAAIGAGLALLALDPVINHQP